MSISPERLANAWKAHETLRGLQYLQTRLMAALEADDLYRASNPTPPPMTEPTLPPQIVLGKETGHYRKNVCPEGDITIDRIFTADDLRGIASHMDYMDRQRTREQEAAKVTHHVTCDMVLDAIASGAAKHGADFVEQVADHLSRTIEAQRSEARKG